METQWQSLCTGAELSVLRCAVCCTQISLGVCVRRAEWQTNSDPGPRGASPTTHSSSCVCRFAMSGLFRSETMVYVRMLMAEETAYATVKEMGRFGQAHVVDLTLRHATSAPNERLQSYKKRVATAAFLERKLQSFLPLFRSYRVEDPSIDVAPLEIAAGDVIDEVRAYLEPVENTLTKNVLYAREQRVALNTLEEEAAVLRTCGVGEAALTAGPSAAGPRGTQSILASGSAGAESYGSFSEQSSLLGSRDEEAGEGEDDERKLDPSHRAPPGFFTTTLHGIINEERFPFFERMVFRVSRGNAVVKAKPLASGFIDPDVPEGPHQRKVSHTHTHTHLCSGFATLLVIDERAPGRM